MSLLIFLRDKPGPQLLAHGIVWESAAPPCQNPHHKKSSAGRGERPWNNFPLSNNAERKRFKVVITKGKIIFFKHPLSERLTIPGNTERLFQSLIDFSAVSLFVSSLQ